MKKRRVGDEAVKHATGRDWASWFAVLDKNAAKKMSHKEIAALLVKDYAVPGWWAQTITVEYEQERKLRKPHQKKDGFEISVSKTIEQPVKNIFNAWTIDKKRTAWLDSAIIIHHTKPFTSIRATWKDGQKSITIHLEKKSPTKTQVVVQHGKLNTQKEALSMKTHWKKALEHLAMYLG